MLTTTNILAQLLKDDAKSPPSTTIIGGSSKCRSHYSQSNMRGRTMIEALPNCHTVLCSQKLASQLAADHCIQCRCTSRTSQPLATRPITWRVTVRPARLASCTWSSLLVQWVSFLQRWLFVHQGVTRTDIDTAPITVDHITYGPWFATRPCCYEILEPNQDQTVVVNQNRGQVLIVAQPRGQIFIKEGFDQSTHHHWHMVTNLCHFNIETIKSGLTNQPINTHTWSQT